MPLQATSGAASYDAFGGGVAAVPNYIEDVFGNYLYTGNGSTQTITNGIDLSTKGGLVWVKPRSVADWHNLYDTARGASKSLATNATDAQYDLAGNGVSAFGTTGFTINGSNDQYNTNAVTYVSWTWRNQPKFFQCLTYTGNGINNRVISHSLGSVPGCIIFKATNTTSDWIVYHRSLYQDFAADNVDILKLNSTAAQTGVNAVINDVSATTFTLGNNAASNAPNIDGATYAAYLFAHDSGGFGLTGTDNVISCGSFTTDGSGNATVNLGYEPQWVLIKSSSRAGSSWLIIDSMRGWVNNGSASDDANLRPNVSDAENLNGLGWPTATGFQYSNFASETWIYIAIRRGPMKVPTSGTSVFSPFVGSDTSTITTGFPVDMLFDNKRAGNSNNTVNASRLVGENALITSSTAAETAGLTSATWFQNNTGYLPNALGTGIVAYAYQRAPSFFDVVCYTGTGSNITLNHNLGAVPELMIFKTRTGAARAWGVYSSAFGVNKKLVLNTTAAVANDSFFVDTTPTATVFYPGNADESNEGGNTYVAYLFATCAGVSKVGSYTGTGVTQTIACGFTGGARFVLVKRTDSTGDWYVWDTARGMVSGTDPSLLLNSTAAEVNANSIYTTTGGFQIVSTAAGINASGGSYIYFSVA